MPSLTHSTSHSSTPSTSLRGHPFPRPPLPNKAPDICRRDIYPQKRPMYPHTFLDGYCSTVQGLLDWFEVDLGFTELLFMYLHKSPAIRKRAKDIYKRAKDIYKRLSSLRLSPTPLFKIDTHTSSEHHPTPPLQNRYTHKHRAKPKLPKTPKAKQNLRTTKTSPIYSHQSCFVFVLCGETNEFSLQPKQKQNTKGGNTRKFFGIQRFDA